MCRTHDSAIQINITVQGHGCYMYPSILCQLYISLSLWIISIKHWSNVSEMMHRTHLSVLHTQFQRQDYRTWGFAFNMYLLHIFLDQNLDSLLKSCEPLSLSFAAKDSTTLTKPLCGGDLAVLQTVFLFIVNMAQLIYKYIFFSRKYLILLKIYTTILASIFYQKIP